MMNLLIANYLQWEIKKTPATKLRGVNYFISNIWRARLIERLSCR